MKYVILAAGLGSRFAKNGEKKPKPLVEIEGRPMIGRLIDILMKHGADQINIVANSRMPELVDYLESLKAEGYPLVVRPIISDNSYYSLSEAAAGIGERFIAMTVDTIFPQKEFAEYVKKSAEAPADTVLMGLTRFIDDESPLYARLGPDGQVIDYRYGGEPYAEGAIVSAGLYALNPEAMEFAAKRKDYPESLSDFQRILAVESPLKVVPFEFSKAMDVDCLHDQRVAEEFLKEIAEK